MENLKFYLNGQAHVVKEPYDASYTLAEYLRVHTSLKGTKVMCREGGCGACVVTATIYDQASQEEHTHAINSCLCPLYGIHGWHITTVEGLGDRKKGYHPIQKRIRDYHASQCGFCTPGMVMSIYGALSKDSKPSTKAMERALDGNLCRCTGYRPILDAAKSFSPDGKNSSCIDIEDLQRPLCPSKGVTCTTFKERSTISFPTKSGSWYKAGSLKEVYSLLEENKDRSTRLVVGNTANGL